MKILKPLLVVSGLSLFAAHAFSQCEPFFGKLVINEVVPGNDNSGADEFGENDDWIEIYNGSGEDINMEGIFLSDNHGGNRTKFRFPDFTLTAGGVVTVWCDDQPEQGDFHAEFRLSASGEEVGLYNQDTTSLDYVRYGDLPDDIAIGRFPNGTGAFKTLIPTFNAANTNSVQQGLVINEYQSTNESTVQDQWGGFEDWIELYNGGSAPIDLGGYFLSDKIGEPTQFVFPDTVLMPDDYIIIWCDQGLMEPGLHTFFKLGGDGDDILLSDTDTLTVDYVRFGVITADETEGRLPNGTGAIACTMPTHEASNGDPLSTPTIEANLGFSVYPNPVNDLFRIKAESFEPGILSIYSSVGSLVYQKLLKSENEPVNVSELPNGFYLVNFNNRIAKLVVK